MTQLQHAQTVLTKMIEYIENNATDQQFLIKHLNTISNCIEDAQAIYEPVNEEFEHQGIETLGEEGLAEYEFGGTIL